MVEALNGLLYLWFFALYGTSHTTVIYSLTASILIIIALVDWRTFEIPVGCNIAIGVLAITNLCFDLSAWPMYLTGFCAVSGLFLLIHLITRGRGIGGGDIKLMAVAGLLLGWQHIILALVIGCVAGSVIHLLLMRFKGKDRLLAFGPYLAFGILTAMLYGTTIITWYLEGWQP
jgi:leader peptidase (prepilin peptidase)/N-methyltransferase